MPRTARQFLLAMFLLAGCVPLPSTPPPTDVALPTAVISASTEIPVTSAPDPTELPTPTEFPTADPAPDLCAVSIMNGHFLLARPIGAADNPAVDATYRYGWTQNGAREVHLGVEFSNLQGTPVLAAADGVVVFAGWDDIEAVGPSTDYYGQVVVIQHDLPGIPEPVYTLNGHLSAISVSQGDVVETGEVIGGVGATGIAIGYHLHFEVRVGENAYTATRNPELWLVPLEEDGIQYGALAGWVLNRFGEPLAVSSVVVKPLFEGARTRFIEGYQSERVHGDDLWHESFGFGGLPPGEYEVSTTNGKIWRLNVEVLPGQLTLVPFCLDR